MNNIKTLFLLVTLTLILIWAGAAMGGKQGMTIAFIFALGMNLFAYWFSDKIVLKMYRAKEVTESEAPDLYRIVRRLAQKAEIPMPRVYLINQDQPNAFATGRNPQHAAVAVTTGIMRILSQEELQGVIGHELSHVKHRDILISTIAATIAGAISFLAQMAQWTLLFGGHRGDDDEGGSPIAAIIMMIVGPIAALIVQMAISRSREYAADEGGAKIAGNPRYLSEALKKLNMASQKIPMNANPATSHMFIVNPLSGGGIVKLFSTHPPIEERIARLESMSL
ncbi:MAG: protease HtpX [Nitrospirae bacterium CG_4_10_14_0_8_um_filter_41_23]|nr:zinc metalloprotease HtpX [Nitrospirota bacterium]OIP60405.1 MAG: protease HtpX [Nitrospirae bacterium CG2_30_41_42]PIQ93466.1 MAG: protease HtpX [Nitrospirae bacterium CG11_big_fil_rev_8_21_14_0_20_41_14]PIV44845.1 MAG: protease HtpX [Nitrospirae bacterium CG02_land_8_20_14_3_00_41_53]PIW86625.1 MAG: protease HtpX [Nitrospirae bacterium CG_4_8_14_3_um_filter_41_47]PIY87755.1 MAG: protease HtpX [Nitrospirae bacterium CG_4_10_14_0_8_um_filter_41_23]PJA78902.1 MAG: protease HtpX [Nitrospirae